MKMRKIELRQEEGWVVCRVSKKKLPAMRKVGDYDSPCWYDDQGSFMQEIDSPRWISHPFATNYHHQYPFKQELDQLQYNINMHNMPPDHPFLQLPQLESPKLVPQSPSSSILPYAYDQRNTTTTTTTTNTSAMQSSTLTQEEQVQQSNNHHQQNLNSQLYNNNINEQAVDQVTDWRVLDKFVASQLSHDPHDVSNDPNYSNASAFQATNEHMNHVLANESKRPENVGQQEYASTSNSAGCQIDMWK